MNTHTPGPWRVDTALEADGSIASLDVRESNYGLFVANVENHAIEHADAEANARLIAAAPELLAALCDLLEQVGACRCRMDFVTDDARAAIAKAEGT